ncbi:metal/formaldehyde-sensitive transcriptional repressor [Oxalobacter formigenes]|uniref:metal/formaldehyde-sensitive transcriptional repressor n=1 Tax=Oxalobacter formigenes TaxID=847 RepID=UPI0025977E8A|nr:metal/formaldehyde-sensitive transcriptional repressor [uncultured Oxalobacter sp.]
MSTFFLVQYLRKQQKERVMHTVHHKKHLLTRVRRIAGQTQALEKALESGSDCNDILQQIAAIRGAVSGLMTEVIEGHIREHLANDEITPEKRSKDVEQVIKTLKSYLK